ncbi:MAG: phospholipase A [Burkholderiales bacterium]
MVTDRRVQPPRRFLLCVLPWALLTGNAWAQLAAPTAPTAPTAKPADGTTCRSITSDAQRLACYDLWAAQAPQAAQAAQAPQASSFGHIAAPAAVAAAVPGAAWTASPEPAPPIPVAVSVAVPAAAALAAPAPTSRTPILSSQWLLEDAGEQLFRLRPYKPMYLLPAWYSSARNGAPSSGAAGRSVGTPADLDSTEAKFQISFKTQVARNLLGTNATIWFGYTQSSRWQVYNEGLSRPFRETNYEPEVMLVTPLRGQIAGWNLGVGSISLNHQSNGRALPLSRSWNRLIARVGLERGPWTITLSPWWRLPESDPDDDNPGIQNFMGRGELVLARESGGHQLSAQLRHSLRGGERSRGSVQLDWAFPITGKLKGHLQWFSGYGESLIDFNHRQNAVGVGISLADWF